LSAGGQLVAEGDGQRRRLRGWGESRREPAGPYAPLLP
jgi:hypothetical protein